MECNHDEHDHHKHWDKDKEELTKEDLLEKKEWLKKKMDWVEEKLKELDK
jgi:hypothetical protein